MSEIPDKEIKYSISVAFYHASSKRFYGSTYIGTEHEGTDGKYILNELLYFRLKCFGPNCYAVLELIATEYTSSTVHGQYGCGWGLIRLDFSENGETVIHQGTPRELLFSDNVQELQQSLPKTISTVQYTLSRAAGNMNQICSDLTLIEDNEIIAASEVVPGLKYITFRSFDERGTTSASCFGGDAVRTDDSLWHFTPAAHLTLARTFAIHISSVKLRFPKEGRMEYEKKLIESLMKSLPSIEISEKKTSFLKFRGGKKIIKSSNNTHLQPRIVHRRIKFAVHNGHTLLGKKGEPWVELDLLTEGNDSDTLCCQVSAEVGNYFKHTLCALVCLVEYIVRLPPIHVIQSHTEHARQGSRSTADLVKILLGYHAYIPYDGERLRLSNRRRLNHLVSLPLINDKTCSFFANERVYTPIYSSRDQMQPILLEFDIYCSDTKTNIRVCDETPLSDNTDVVITKSLSIVHNTLENGPNEEKEGGSITEDAHRNQNSESQVSNIVEKAVDSSILSSNTYEMFLELQEQRKSATKSDDQLSQHGYNSRGSPSPAFEALTLDNTIRRHAKHKDLYGDHDCAQIPEDMVRTKNYTDLTKCIENKGIEQNDQLRQLQYNLNRCSPSTISECSTLSNTVHNDSIRKDDTEIQSEPRLGCDYAQAPEVIVGTENYGCPTNSIKNSATIANNPISTRLVNSTPEHIIAEHIQHASNKNQNNEPESHLPDCNKISFEFFECNIVSDKVDKVFFKFHFFDHPECLTSILDTRIDRKECVASSLNSNITVDFEHDFSSSLPYMLTYFERYLETKTLTIEIWDAQSKLHIGIALISLIPLVSLSTSNADSKVFASNDIFGETGVLELPYSNSIGNIRVQLKSEANLRPQFSTEKKRRCAREISLTDIEASWTSNQPLSISLTDSLTGKDACQRSNVAKTNQTVHLSSDQPQAQFFHKLMEGYNGNFYQETLEAIAINWYRREKKLDFLSRCIKHATAQVVTIFAPFAEAIFLEIEIKNPLNNKDRFRLEVDGPELKVLTGGDELQYFRSNINAVTVRANVGEKCVKLQGIPESLHEGEITFISIEKEVVSFPCVLANRCVEERITKHIKVYSSNGENVRHVEINVIPRLPTIDKSFRLVASEGQLIERTIQRPALDFEHFQIHYVNIAPNPVICTREGNSIIIRCYCGNFHAKYTFLLLIYADKYLSQLTECFKFQVQGYEHMMPQQGELYRTGFHSFSVKATEISRGHLSIYSDRSENVKISPEEFRPITGTTNSFKITYKFSDPGHHHIIVHLIDDITSEIAYGWIMRVFIPQTY